jgi:glucokinase
VSWERVLSGPGLVQLFDFMVEVEKVEPHAELRRQVTPARVSQAALAGTCPAADAALDLFVELLGSESANLALKLMARGGVFLGGGIAPKILERLRQPAFLEAFCSKGRMRPILERMPIVVVLAGGTALLGAARYATAVAERHEAAETAWPRGLRPG